MEVLNRLAKVIGLIILVILTGIILSILLALGYVLVVLIYISTGKDKTNKLINRLGKMTDHIEFLINRL